jgi:hypothetical protein
MDFIETKVFREPWDVNRRLTELKLDRKRLLSVVAVALNSGANATLFHPANAAGTFAYQDGSWSLRDQFVGEVWGVDRADGIEAIKCEALKVKVAFSNVDVACDASRLPKPRSRKGAGAERASGTGLFGDLPQYAARPSGDWALYYLMADDTGAAELTRPVVRGGAFVAAIERLFLSNGDEGGEEELLQQGPDDIADDFDPQVARKK